MQTIGRKIYYNKISGEILLEKFEMIGDVEETTLEEDISKYPELQTIPLSNLDYIQLEYGERTDEFVNMGSCKVDPVTKQLTIYPRLSISSDKAQINNDGVEVATIIVNLPNIVNEEVIFKVNNEGNYIVNSVDGIATFQFTSTVLGTFSISAHSNKYGSNVVNIEVV